MQEKNKNPTACDAVGRGRRKATLAGGFRRRGREECPGEDGAGDATGANEEEPHARVIGFPGEERLEESEHEPGSHGRPMERSQGIRQAHEESHGEQVLRGSDVRAADAVVPEGTEGQERRDGEKCVCGESQSDELHESPGGRGRGG